MRLGSPEREKICGGKSRAWQNVLSRPLADDAAACARFKLRKEQSGIAHRDEIKTFVDYIDADEKRI